MKEKEVVKSDSDTSTASTVRAPGSGPSSEAVARAGGSSGSSQTVETKPPIIQSVKRENVTPENVVVAPSDAGEATMASFMSMFPMPVLDLDSDLLEEKFKHFKFIHEQRMVAGKVAVTEVEISAASFKAALPEAAQIIIMNYDFVTNEKDPNNIEHIAKVICAAKKKRASRIVARNRFLNRTMRPGESFTDFKTAVYQLAEQCGYEQKFKEELLRDHIIRAHSDEAIQYELLKLPDDSTLDKVVELCKRHEDTVAAARDIQSQRLHQVNLVNTKKKGG
jgi:hypothetical protein